MVAGLKAGYDKLTEHGWLPWLSCQPQVNTCIPKMGEYCASSESSAAAYINTILGARTNRESPINTVYCRLHRLPAQVRQPPRRESGGQMHCRAG